MKQLIVSVLLILLLAIGGCAYVIPDDIATPNTPPPVETTEPLPSDVQPEPTKPQPEPVNVQPVVSTVDDMVCGSLFFTPTSDEIDFVVLAPAYFEFGTVSPDSNIDTRTDNGYLQVGSHRLNYKKGDPLYFVIFNDSVNSYTFEIKYENAVDEVNWSEATQLAYFKAPLGVQQAVAIAESSVELQSGEAITIPFSVTLSDDMEYPELWEFRLAVLRKVPGSTQEVGAKIRVFVSMK